MALLERVATLIRANLNDLVDKAEDPEKMIKQVILDMQNQLLQLKTQVAIAIADQHVLTKKKKDAGEQEAEWVRKAEFAVGKKQDDLARAALEKSIASRRAAESFEQQIADQSAQVDSLKTALTKLQVKLAETESQAEVIIAQHRRGKVLQAASEARWNATAAKESGAFGRMKSKAQRAEAEGLAKSELLADSTEDRFASLERDEEVERMLADLRAKKSNS